MNPREYLQTQLLGANPVELVWIVYQAAIDAIEEARLHLTAGEIMVRSKSISRVLDCLSELTLSLNHEVGGEISRNLARLYAYIQQLVLKAHAEHSDAKLVEAQQLLRTLQEAWKRPGAANPPPPPIQVRREPDPPPLEPDLPPVCSANPYDSGSAMAASARGWQL